jgi:hypothetical protein
MIAKLAARPFYPNGSLESGLVRPRGAQVPFLNINFWRI